MATISRRIVAPLLGVLIASTGACTSAASQTPAATSSAPAPAATTSATAPAETETPTPTATPSPTATSPSASPSATVSVSPSLSPTPSPSPTPTTDAPGPAGRAVQDVDWDNAKLPIMCGGAVELVQLKRGTGKAKDGLVVEFLDVTFGSVTSDPAEDIAVVQLDCIGAHPGPVDAPVFRSGDAGPEFLGFATMSLDKFGSVKVSRNGIVVHGIGYSDKAPGCCPDLAATMTSAVRGNSLAFQERDTAPLRGAKPGTECEVLTQIDAQLADLAKQTRGHAATRTPVPLAKVTTVVAAQRASSLLGVVKSQLQRGCP